MKKIITIEQIIFSVFLYGICFLAIINREMITLIISTISSCMWENYYLESWKQCIEIHKNSEQKNICIYDIFFQYKKLTGRLIMSMLLLLVTMTNIVYGVCLPFDDSIVLAIDSESVLLFVGVSIACLAACILLFCFFLKHNPLTCICNDIKNIEKQEGMSDKLFERLNALTEEKLKKYFSGLFI